MFAAFHRRFFFDFYFVDLAEPDCIIDFNIIGFDSCVVEEEAVAISDGCVYSVRRYQKLSQLNWKSAVDEEAEEKEAVQIAPEL